MTPFGLNQSCHSFRHSRQRTFSTRCAAQVFELLHASHFYEAPPQSIVRQSPKLLTNLPQTCPRVLAGEPAARTQLGFQLADRANISRAFVAGFLQALEIPCPSAPH